MRVFKKQGITMIEILAVLVILGIIAAIAVPTVNTLIRNTRERANIASLNNYVDAARLHALSFEGDTVTVLASELETTGELFFFLNADGGVGINPIDLRFVLTQGVVSEVLLEGTGVTGSDNELWVSNRLDGSQAVRVFFANGVFSRGDDLLFDGSDSQGTFSRIYYTDFDAHKAGYAPGTLSLDGVSWMFYNALTGTLANDKTDVGRAARLTVNRNNVPDENDSLYDAHAIDRGFIQPTSAFSNVARIDFTAAIYGNDSGVTMKLEISINGVDWVPIQDSFILSSELQVFVVVLNYNDYAGISENDAIFIRITNNSNSAASNIRRLNIDEFEIFELIP